MTTFIDDSSTILRLQSGDLDALGELYDRYKTCTYRTALAITHDPSAADDILQDCFLRVYRYADSIDPTRPLAPWLYRVTVNLAYTWSKKQKRWQISLEEVKEKLVNPFYTSPEKVVERRNSQDEVIDAIASLNIRQRTVVVLFYLNALSLDEIAEILECPVGTVKSRLYYGRERLRSRLSQAARTTFELGYEAAM